MPSFQGMIFQWIQIYWEIFKPALVYLEYEMKHQITPKLRFYHVLRLTSTNLKMLGGGGGVMREASHSICYL